MMGIENTNLFVSSDGNVRLRLRNGQQIVLPGTVDLGIRVEDPQFHSYQTRTLVGFVRDDFDPVSYLQDSVNEPSLVGAGISLFEESVGFLHAPYTSADNAFVALKHNPAPLATYGTGTKAVSTGDVSPLLVVGPVSHVVIPEQRMVVNITLPEHMLNPGIVVRYIAVENGQIFVVTEGIGVGPFREPISLLDEAIWAPVDIMIRHDLADFGREGEILPDRLPPRGEIVGDDGFRGRINLAAPARCFPAGTPVCMADGGERPIEQIEVGDQVAAFDAAAHSSPAPLSGNSSPRTRRSYGWATICW